MKATLAFDTMERILPFVAAIVNDAETQDVVSFVRKAEKNSPVGESMAKVLPLFVGPHREDMFGIVAGLKGITVEDAKELDLSEIIKVFNDSNTLYDMLSFFTCCLRLVRVV